MHRNRTAFRIALVEIIAFQHPRHRVLRGEADKIRGRQSLHPVRIKDHLRLVAVKHLEYLILVRLGVRQHLLLGQRRTCRILAGGIANHRGEIANQKQHRVPGILELAQLVQDNRVAEMQIRRGRVHAQLHPQPLARLQLGDKLFLADKILGAAPKQRQLRIHTHRHKHLRKNSTMRHFQPNPAPPSPCHNIRTTTASYSACCPGSP